MQQKNEHRISRVSLSEAMNIIYISTNTADFSDHLPGSVILVQKIIFILVFIWFIINHFTFSSNLSAICDKHFTSILVFIPQIILVLV